MISSALCTATSLWDTTQQTARVVDRILVRPFRRLIFSLVNEVPELGHTMPKPLSLLNMLESLVRCYMSIICNAVFRYPI